MLINNFPTYIDMFASSIVLIIFLALLYKRAYLSINGKQLIILSFLIFILTLFEGLSFSIDSRISEYYRLTNEILNFILFLLTPLLIGFWVKYTYYLCFKSQADKKHLLLFFTPTILIFILVVINIFVPFIYEIDQFGEYTRLQGYVFVSIPTYIIVAYTILLQGYFVIKQRSFDIFILLISNLIAFFGSFIQLTNSSFPSFYSFITIGFVIIYVFFESIEDQIDQMTKFYDRRKIYEIIHSKISLNQDFSLVLLDLDDLKIMNDNYGHYIGDLAIVSFSKSLFQAFHKKAVFGRIGGDEFVLISSLSEDEINAKLSNINNEFDNDSDKYNYEFSYGISHSKDHEDVNIDILLKESDDRMYEMKSKHKNYMRRKSDIERKNFQQ